MKVAILDDYQNVARTSADWGRLPEGTELSVLADHLKDEAAVAERLAGFEVVVAMRERTPFPRSLLTRLPNLKLLVTTGLRNASIDVAAAAEQGVTVCGTTGMSTGTSELTWGLILSLTRHIHTENRNVREGKWQTTIGPSLEGHTLGLVGLGRLGSNVAKVGLAFGMRVIAWSQNLTPERAEAIGATAVSKEELFSQSDVISVHYILSPRSRGMITAEDFARMKPDALFVNTSRGPIADEAALLDTLRNHRIAGAGLDVFEEEPLPAAHPFLQLDNLLITPHIGYVTTDNYRIFYGDALEDVLAFMNGAPVRVISPS
ncbi:MAG: D-2-hydroxyacid dehydrogenase family protein [Dehalococcoidia bacterium]